PTELALIEVLKDLGPIVLEIAKAHVQHRRRRDCAVVVYTCRVVHLVLRNCFGKRLREAICTRRYGVGLVEVPREMVLVVEVMVDLEGRDRRMPEVCVTGYYIVV